MDLNMPTDTPICRGWANGAYVPTPPAPKPSKAAAEKRAEELLAKHRRMVKNTGALLHEFKPSTIARPADPVRIKNLTFLASYNWRNSINPVIFVPGCPAKWTPPTLPYQVLKDHGQVFIDQNTFRSPRGPFEPFFAALLTMHPDFDMGPIALVTDRNSLRKLLAFASGRVPKSWRIDAEVVEGTLFLTRWEEHTVQNISGAAPAGYGHEFEKAFLRFDPELRQSSGHHRIVRYELGGIDCLVRFEADGYVDDDGEEEGEGDPSARSSTQQQQSPGDTPAIVAPPQTHLLKDLEHQLSSLHLQDESPSAKTPPSGHLHVHARGRLISNTQILELKSRGANFSLAATIPQLWLSQTRHLIVGRHRAGLVSVPPERMDLVGAGVFREWEGRNEGGLRGLAGLLVAVRDVVRRRDVEGKARAVLVACKSDAGEKTLRIYEWEKGAGGGSGRGMESVLSREVRERLWKKRGEERGESGRYG